MHFKFNVLLLQPKIQTIYSVLNVRKIVSFNCWSAKYVSNKWLACCIWTSQGFVHAYVHVGKLDFYYIYYFLLDSSLHTVPPNTGKIEISHGYIEFHKLDNPVFHRITWKPIWKFGFGNHVTMVCLDTFSSSWRSVIWRSAIRKQHVERCHRFNL